MENPTIRAAREVDATAVANIYNHYVLSSIATFEEQPVADDEMTRRMRGIADTRLPWLVATVADDVVGYAYAAPWKSRSAYRHSAEITVYLDPEHTGRGFGNRLYEKLFAVMEHGSVHTVIGGVALPNPASIALHERFGMRKVAHFKEVGYKFDRWIDVGYWQVAL